jgi:hypothetical protein
MRNHANVLRKPVRSNSSDTFEGIIRGFFRATDCFVSAAASLAVSCDASDFAYPEIRKIHMRITRILILLQVVSSIWKGLLESLLKVSFDH